MIKVLFWRTLFLLTFKLCGSSDLNTATTQLENVYTATSQSLLHRTVQSFTPQLVCLPQNVGGNQQIFNQAMFICVPARLCKTKMLRCMFKKISASCNIGGIEVCIQYLRNVYLVVRMITMAVGVEQNAMINIVSSARGVL